MIATTTLNKIQAHNPCYTGMAKLLVGLRKIEPDDEPLELYTIFVCEGLRTAIWCLRAVDSIEKEKKLFLIGCGRQVLYLNPHERVVRLLNTAEKYAKGECEHEELKAAREAAIELIASPLPGATKGDVFVAVGEYKDLVIWTAIECTRDDVDAVLDKATGLAMNAAVEKAHMDVINATKEGPISEEAVRDAGRVTGHDLRVQQAQQFIKMFCTE